MEIVFILRADEELIKRKASESTAAPGQFAPVYNLITHPKE
jgi:hypothetical protein